MRENDGVSSSVPVQQRIPDRLRRGPCCACSLTCPTPQQDPSSFLIDIDVPHGMSGGPVFNEAGFVCGVVSSGARHFFGVPATLVSMLYPTLLTTIRRQATIGPLSLDAERRMLELIETKSVRTDGSEQDVTISQPWAQF